MMDNAVQLDVNWAIKGYMGSNKGSKRIAWEATIKIYIIHVYNSIFSVIVAHKQSF